MSPPDPPNIARHRTSASDTRPHASRNTSSRIQQAESLILPDGPVSEETAELLDEFVHGTHTRDSTLTDIGENNHRDDHHSQPWWKTPSSWWLIVLLPFGALASTATLAPRIEILTILACSVIKPEIFDVGKNSSSLSPFVSLVQLVNSTGLASPGSGIPQTCAQDPDVQAAVAQLSAVLTATMGVLSCLTTAWWGSFSDRYGRTRVIGISLLGLLMNDLNFIFVTRFFRYAPGGYWFLLVGPIIEGSVGGLASSIAAMHAYVADTTTSHGRSRMFSLSLGLMFTGVALGPALGSLLIRATHQTLSVFYAATVAHLIYASMVWFIVPESLTKRQMHEFKAKHIENEAIFRDRDRSTNSLATEAIIQIRNLLRFLRPLAIFFPTMVETKRGPRRDWSLALVAASYGFTISIMGSYVYKFQYAASAFGWSAETIGYWISLVGAVRAAFLALILPVIIQLSKPKATSASVETEPLLSSSSEPSGSSQRPSPTSSPRSLLEIHSPTFDLSLARASLLVEIVAYSFMAMAQAPLPFTIFAMLGSFGAGFSPAIQSAAIELYVRRGGRENGRLYGALSVVQALCSQILGPAIFGFTYVRTVATYPRAIFFLSVAAVFSAFVLLGFVRIPKHVRVDEEDAVPFESSSMSRDATLIGGDDAEENGQSPKKP
ncbi:MFS general substrate transporter [Pleurotus eryngii]|uniref:MFS general substrate transporter n=1 Tax=Pleurotus eryngii TaxID=5323 RepID=A0A9P6A952_PLEER|nr:MFS general substrate transporter [Pleurotus eryngii]